jgi:hypothetical protein
MIRAERQARIRALGENPVTWSTLRHFHVEQTTFKNIAQPKERNRGFLVVRLIPSTRGEVIIGLDEAVRHMSLGETCSVKVLPSDLMRCGLLGRNCCLE